MRDITLCYPRLQMKAAQLTEECRKQGLLIKIGETLRTAAEQDALYAQGRTKPGSIVTNAKGSTYRSMHQWGVAFDFFRNDGQGAYNESGNFFNRVGQIGKGIGLEWGGSWTSIQDKPHFQLPEWGSTPTELIRQYGTPDSFMKTWKDDTTGWVTDAYGFWYRKPDGSYPANKWCIINHHWYLFNCDGYACTGWHRWDGQICDPDDGRGDWFYFDNTKGGSLECACWHSRDNGAQEIWWVDGENII